MVMRYIGLVQSIEIAKCIQPFNLQGPVPSRRAVTLEPALASQALPISDSLRPAICNTGKKVS